ncbi:hypothetical protein [Janthinobacterium sp. B9-8]|uniref:hypothetical protein n=1 Tax=Janthinobacterium sp. B9-8 TaxID=1236179 RepID=UPI00061D1F13|nr:hypothetical protein [Janthinobacterium sp. B9-8]AMC34989.1 hypothetical protein VN23_10390 [Janthinobacterium sp. B9-8]
MTANTEQKNNDAVEQEVKSDDIKSKVLSLQALAEISAGLADKQVADWSTVSNHCGSNDQQ